MKSVSNSFYDAVVCLVELLEGDEDISWSEFDPLLQLLRAEIDRKKAANFRRKLYTLSKTSDDLELREAARQAYLDEAGVSPDFRC